MAKVHGKGGSLTCTNLTAGINEWSLDISGEAVDVTDFSDAGVKAFIAGLKEWKGSASGFWDAANTVAVNDVITSPVFTYTTGKYYTGASAIVTNIKTGASITGVCPFSIEFQGSGALTPTFS